MFQENTKNCHCKQKLAEGSVRQLRGILKECQVGAVGQPLQHFLMKLETISNYMVPTDMI